MGARDRSRYRRASPTYPCQGHREIRREVVYEGEERKVHVAEFMVREGKRKDRSTGGPNETRLDGLLRGFDGGFLVE